LIESAPDIWELVQERRTHPPTMALAVPTMSLVKKRVVQYWHMTKDPPAIPIKRRRTANPPAELTSPVMAVGMAATQSTALMRMRLPYLSQSGPNRNRMKMVPPTPTMLAVHSSVAVKLRVFWISDWSGVMENQMKKAQKKDTHEQWNALIGGREVKGGDRLV
jgi:hypothetical protein